MGAGSLRPSRSKPPPSRGSASFWGQGLTPRRIAETLEAEGRPTKWGGRWAAMTVARVLRRAA